MMNKYELKWAECRKSKKGDNMVVLTLQDDVYQEYTIFCMLDGKGAYYGKQKLDKVSKVLSGTRYDDFNDFHINCVGKQFLADISASNGFYNLKEAYTLDGEDADDMEDDDDYDYWYDSDGDMVFHNLSDDSYSLYMH